MLPMFLAVVDQTIVATALPAIAADFGNVEQISWVMVAYLVAATIFAPVYGGLGDHFGRRRLLHVALAVALAGSILCALSVSVEMLVAARVVQGIGGAGLMVLAQALIGETMAPRDRARYQGYLASIAVTASVFGPVAGGLLTESFGWRSIFIANLPLGFAAVTLLFRLPRRPRRSEIFRFDFPGLVLITAFVVSLLLMLQRLQQLSPVDTPIIVGLAAVSLISLLLLIRREGRSTHPLFSLPLLQHASIWRSAVLAACHGGALVALLTFMPIYLRLALGVSSADIGLILVPMTVGIGLGSLITGRIVSYTGRTALFPVVGLIGVIVVLLFLAGFARHLSVWQLAAVLGLLAILMGTVMNVVHLTVQIAAGIERIGTAAATIQFARSLGAAFGTALVGTILFATLAVRDMEAASMLGLIIQGGPEVLSVLPAARQAAISSEIADAFAAAFLTIASFAAIGLALAWTQPIRKI